MLAPRDALLSDVADGIVSIPSAGPVRVAIDGVDGAGKSTLADDLLLPIERLGRPVIRASVDGFHNPRSIRYARGSDSAEGFYHHSYDYRRLTGELLEPLGPGGSRTYRTCVFDHRTDRAVDMPYHRAADNAILLLDGIFLHRPELRHHWDFTIFVCVDFNVAIERLLRRDGVGEGEYDDGARVEFLRRWGVRYRAGQELYLNDVNPLQLASLIVYNDDPCHPRLERRSRP